MPSAQLIRRHLVTLVVAASAAVACSAPTSPPSGSASAPTLAALPTRPAVGVTLAGNTLNPPQLTNLWVFVPEQHGIANQHGIKLTIQETGSSTNTLSAIQADQVEFGILASGTLWNAAAQASTNPSYRVIAAGTVDLPFDVVVNGDRIKSIPEMAKARVAVAQLGTIAHTQMLALLRQNGLDPGGVQWYPTQSVAGEQRALIGNDADVTVMLHTETGRVLAEARQRNVNLRILVSAAQLREMAPIGGTLILASNKVMQQPEVVQNFIDGHLDGVRLLYQDQAKYVETANRLQPGHDEAYVTDLYQVFQPILGVNGGLSRSMYRKVYDTWATYVNPEAAARLSWDQAQQLYDQRFIDAYLKKNSVIGGVLDAPDWR